MTLKLHIRDMKTGNPCQCHRDICSNQRSAWGSLQLFKRVSLWISIKYANRQILVHTKPKHDWKKERRYQDNKILFLFKYISKCNNTYTTVENYRYGCTRTAKNTYQPFKRLLNSTIPSKIQRLQQSTNLTKKI